MVVVRGRGVLGQAGAQDEHLGVPGRRDRDEVREGEGDVGLVGSGRAQDRHVVLRGRQHPLGGGFLAVGSKVSGASAPLVLPYTNVTCTCATRFGSLEDYMWKLTWKWARYSHQNKPPRWVAARYYGTFSSSRDDRWVFGDKDTGAYLIKHPWTAIRRHIMVKGAASPDDPGLAGYWRYRRDKHAAPLDPHTGALLARQGKNCPLCGDPLIGTSHLPGSDQGVAA